MLKFRWLFGVDLYRCAAGAAFIKQLLYGGQGDVDLAVLDACQVYFRRRYHLAFEKMLRNVFYYFAVFGLNLEQGIIRGKLFALRKWLRRFGTDK